MKRNEKENMATFFKYSMNCLSTDYTPKDNLKGKYFKRTN